MKFISARSSLRSQVPIHGKARAGQLGGALQIEHAQLFAQLPMRLGREVELRRRSPAAHFDVVGLALADRHTVVRQVGNAGQDIAQPRVGFFGDLLGFGNLLAQIFGLVDQRGGVLLVLLELGDFFRRFVALGFQGFGFGDRGAAIEIDGVEIAEDGFRIHAASAQFFFNQRSDDRVQRLDRA